MKRTRVCFSMLVISLLLLLSMQPVLADDDIYDQEVSINYYRIPWGNGIDDDGDGDIDNFGELDVEYGDVDVNYSNSLVDDWYMDFKYGATNVSNTPSPGVKIAGCYEELWQIDSTSNVSVSPTTTCYDRDASIISIGGYEEVEDVLNAVTFYIELKASQIMTGCQEFWYRSPLCWETDIYDLAYGSVPAHYLNIYNEDNELVFAGLPTSGYGIFSDNSTDGTDYKRVYYKIQMPFESNERYRFEEYVKTIDDNPINSIKLYMCRVQDIASDENTDTYIFKGSGYSRKIPVECSWGMLCTIGKGISGTERVILSGPAVGSADPVIYTQYSPGGDINDVDAITLVFPLRTSKALNITVVPITESGGDYNTDGGKTFTGITGTAILNFNITDPNPAAPNTYRFQITINNFDEGAGDAMTYTMYPSDGTWHILTAANTVSGQQDWPAFAVHFEVAEHAAAIPEESLGVDLEQFLIGVGMVILGLYLITAILSAGISIPILLKATIIGVFVAVGAGLVEFSFTEQSLLKFPEWFANRLPRAARQIWEGITTIAGGIADVIVRVVETIKKLGSALFYWGGAILEAIVDIVYFVTAVVVWWLTAKFLSIMGAIRDGDVERASRTILSVEGSIRGQTRKRVGDVKSVYSGGKKVYRRIRPKSRGR